MSDTKRFRIGGAAGYAVIGLGEVEAALHEIRVEDRDGQAVLSADQRSYPNAPPTKEDVCAVLPAAFDEDDATHLVGLVGLAWTRRAMAWSPS